MRDPLKDPRIGDVVMYQQFGRQAYTPKYEVLEIDGPMIKFQRDNGVGGYIHISEWCRHGQYDSWSVVRSS